MTSALIHDSARDWAIWLTQQPSVNGHEGEQALPLRLASRIATTPALAGCSTWLIPAPGDMLGRSCLALLVRGGLPGRETVLLTGHFDTVTVEDYGDLAPLATEPLKLAGALIERLAEPRSEMERLALADLASGDFLPGRGLLDMKSGLAAGLAAAEAFAADPASRGNLLFVAVPDEEVNSVGARALAAALPQIEEQHGIAVRAAINLDCIGDRGDGSEGRAVALGSVGKLLLTALVVGEPAHASHPFQGINAGALAGALAARIEWAPELADGQGGAPGIPPVLLSLKDAKQRYDVTTPDMAFATWNALSQGRPAADILEAFSALAAEAADGFAAQLAMRRAMIEPECEPAPSIPVITSASLMAGLANVAGASDRLKALGAELSAQGLSLPDQNERMTQEAWRLSRQSGPAIIIGFGSLPYPAVSLRRSIDGVRFTAAIDEARARAAALSGASIIVTPFFPGISDMSFIGEGDTADVGLIAANTPAWVSGVRWAGIVGGVPTVNIGPWGRDYHTPLERVHQGYTFGVLPGLLLDIATTFLADSAA